MARDMARSIAKQSQSVANEPVGPIVFRMLVASICASMLLSGRLLWQLGINYLTADASAIEKIHISTYMILITFIVWVVQSGGDENRIIDVKKIKPAIYYSICSVFILIYAVTFLDGQLALVVDSFICPPLYVMMMGALTRRQRNIVLALILGYISINVVILFYEVAASSLFLPPVYNDFTDLKVVHTAAASEFEGRASGLYGHPLAAGTITLIFLVGAIETVNQLRWKLATMAIMAGAIATFPTFGSRWSLLLFILYCGFVAVRFMLNIAKSRRISQQSIVILFVIGLAALPMGAAAYQLGVFDKLIERIEDDNGSAASRVAAWNLFISSDLDEIMLGDVDGKMADKLFVRETTYGIEVFWLGFVMRYGVICSLIFFPALLALMYQLRRDGGTMGTMVGIAFLAVISGSLSILGKTQLFSQVVIVAYAMMPTKRASLESTGRQIKRAVSAHGPLVSRAGQQGPRWSEASTLNGLEVPPR